MLISTLRECGQLFGGKISSPIKLSDEKLSQAFNFKLLRKSPIITECVRAFISGAQSKLSAVIPGAQSKLSAVISVA